MVPRDAPRLRFFFDESALGVGKALAIARRDVVHAGHPLIAAEAPLGALDTQWIPAVASRELVVVARDRRISTKPAELRVLREHRLRVLWIAGKRDMSTWDNLVRMVRRWRDIENVMRERDRGPWFMPLREHDLAETRLRA